MTRIWHERYQDRRDHARDEPAAPAPQAVRSPQSALPQEEIARLTDDIVAALKTVYDPEIPADIYELGLIYKVDIKDDRAVDVDMTLTTPNCPAAAELPMMVENAVASVAGVGPVKVRDRMGSALGSRAGCRTRPASC